MQPNDAKKAGPAVTSKNVPTPGVPPLVPSQAAEVAKQAAAKLPDEDIVARPLVLPDYTDLRPRNPLLKFRWVNRVAGEGQRLYQMEAMGFVKVTSKDVVGPDGKPIPEYLIKNGQIVYGDLVLMKISREAYLGALKYNEQRAVDRISKAAFLKRAKKMVSEELSRVGSPATPKITTFVPGQAETEALVGGKE